VIGSRPRLIVEHALEQRLEEFASAAGDTIVQALAVVDLLAHIADEWNGRAEHVLAAAAGQALACDNHGERSGREKEGAVAVDDEGMSRVLARRRVLRDAVPRGASGSRRARYIGEAGGCH